MRIALICLLLTSLAIAQTAPTTQSYHVTVPPGFVRIIESGHTVIAEPADRPWIETALRHLPPASQPSTRPADLIANLQQHRAAIRDEMIKLLAIRDPARVDTFLDETLRPLIERYADLKPPLMFLVTTQPRLKQILKDGWSDPHFHYNRAADDVQVARGVRLSIDGPLDENLLPIIFGEEIKPDDRIAAVSKAVPNVEYQVAAQIANRAEADMQLSLIAFTSREVFEPLQLKQDQVWFSIGASGVLSSHFVETIDQIPAEEFVGGLSRDRRDNPFRNADIDLLHPTPLTELRSTAVPAYSDAYQRKSIRVIDTWMKQAGLDAPAKVINALRTTPAADGNALLKVIQQTSGVDLSDAIKAGR